MRIAFSGSHRVGKSTLLAAVARALGDHDTVDEPYHLLEDDGYEHSDPPSLEDFEAQLEASLEVLGDDRADLLFDRCPADAVAYLLCHDDADGFELDEWRARIQRAMATLDAVVLVPIEAPDRIALTGDDDRAYRRAVHDRLEELLLDDGLGLDTDVVVVRGSLAERLEQVLALGRAAAPR